MKSAVMFYSYTGNCRNISNYIAKTLNIDTIELVEESPRKGLLGNMRGVVQALTNTRIPLLDGKWQDLSEYSTIYIVFPIWASNVNPAVNTFIEFTNLTGKKVHIISVQGNKNIGKYHRTLDYLSKFIRYKGGRIGSFVTIVYSKKSTPESIPEQLDNFLARRRHY
jgi:flavodoxin